MPKRHFRHLSNILRKFRRSLKGTLGTFSRVFKKTGKIFGKILRFLTLKSSTADPVPRAYTNLPSLRNPSRHRFRVPTRAYSASKNYFPKGLLSGDRWPAWSVPPSRTISYSKKLYSRSSATSLHESSQPQKSKQRRFRVPTQAYSASKKLFPNGAIERRPLVALVPDPLLQRDPIVPWSICQKINKRSM